LRKKPRKSGDFCVKKSINRLSGLSALRLGFAFLGIPVCLTAVLNPAGGFRVAG